MPILSFLAAPQRVDMTTWSSAKFVTDNKVGIMTIIGFQQLYQFYIEWNITYVLYE